MDEVVGITGLAIATVSAVLAWLQWRWPRPTQDESPRSLGAVPSRHGGRRSLVSGWHRPSTGAVPASLVSKRVGAFVGRSVELDALRWEWERVQEGASGVVVVSGEAGTGKSELMYEFSHRVGSDALVIACRPSLSGTRAQALVADLIRQIVASAAPTVDLSSLETVRKRALGRLVPEIFGPDGSEVIPPPSSLGDLTALCEAVGWLLKQATVETPLLAIIEDVHAATSDSLKVLSALTELRLPTTLFILTTRTHEPGARQIEELIEIARATGAFRALELRELTAEDVIRLTESVAMPGNPVDLATALYRRTNGHPFFVTSLLLTMRNDPAAAIDGRFDRAHVPREIAAHIAQRASKLTQRARRTLELAAVIGDDITVALLTDAMDAPHDELVDDLIAVTAAGFLASDTSDSGRLHFSHDLVRDTVYSHLHVLRRAQIHRAIADAMLVAHSPDLVTTFARHCHAAANVYPELRDRSVNASIEAARDSVDRIAYGDAIDHYRRAIGHASSDLQRARIEGGLGDTLARSGDLRAARTHLESAVQLARRQPDIYLLAEITTTLSTLAYRSNTPGPDLRNLCEETLTLLPDDEVYWRVRLLAGIVREAPDQPASPSLALTARRVLESALHDEDPATRSFGFLVQHESLIADVDSTKRAAVAAQMATAAEAAQDPFLISTAHMLSVAAALEHADAAAAAEAIDACKHVADRFRYPYGQWLAAMLRAGCAVWQRPLAEAADRIENARDLGRPLGYAEVDLAYQIQCCLLDRELGRQESMLPLVRMAVEAHAHPGWKAALGVFVCETDGADRDEAVRLLEEIEADGLDQIARYQSNAVILCALAEAYAYLDDQKGAARLLPMMEANRRFQPVTGYTASYCGSIDYRLGVLHSMLGDHDSAITDYELAYEVEDRADSPLWTCHTRIAHAQTLRSRAHPGDIDTALRLESKARQAAKALGYTRALRQLDEPLLGVSQVGLESSRHVSRPG